MILNSDLILQFTEYDFQKSHRRDELDSTWIRLDEVNKQLREEMSKWPVVCGHPTAVSSDPKHHNWSMVDPNNPFYTHRSRIAPPQPIRTETAEDVLRDFVERYDRKDFEHNKFEYMIERARKVLK